MNFDGASLLGCSICEWLGFSSLSYRCLGSARWLQVEIAFINKHSCLQPFHSLAQSFPAKIPPFLLLITGKTPLSLD
jgi:hypothetical protein